MDQICEACAKEPGTHSFSYICRTKNTDKYEYIFYTCIGDSKKYNDTQGILSHYRNCLETMNPDKWIWIFNCDGYSLKHYAEIGIAKKLAKLVKEFGRVEKIYMINAPPLLSTVMTLIKPILDEDTFGKIEKVNVEKLMHHLEHKVHHADYNSIKQMVTPKYNV